MAIKQNPMLKMNLLRLFIYYPLPKTECSVMLGNKNVAFSYGFFGKQYNKADALQGHDGHTGEIRAKIKLLKDDADAQGVPHLQQRLVDVTSAGGCERRRGSPRAR